MSPTYRGNKYISEEEFARLEQVRDEFEFGNNGGRRRPFNYRYLSEVLADPIPAPPLQIEGLCREGELFILTGPADSLKSRTITEAAIAVASGAPLFGHFRILRPGKALIVQNEIHAGVFDERLLRYADPKADWLDNLIVVSRQDFRIDEQSMRFLDNIIATEKITFVSLDPLSEMYPDEDRFDENRSEPMTEMLNRLKAVRDRNITIGFAHHDPKDRERRARGSGRLIDAPDLRIFMSPASRRGLEVARVRVNIRSRTLIPPDDFDLVLGNDGRLRHEQATLTDEQEETLDVVRRLGRPTTQEVADALGIERTAAYHRLDRLRQRGKVKASGSPQRWSVP